VKKSMSIGYFVTTLVISMAVVIMSQPAQALTSNLTVMVEGLKSKQGQVCARVFAQSDGFPNRQDRAIASQCISVNKISSGFKFANLAPGSYAVALFHDANSDGKINTGLFGIPTEGMGCSRNPRGLTGAPRFQDAVFLVVGPNNAIEIQLNYL
jgi:uncharacterized protein (DUF2141 family)